MLDTVDAHDRVECAVRKRQGGVHVGGGEGRAGPGKPVHDVGAAALEPEVAQTLEERALAAGDVQHGAALRLRPEQARDDRVRVLRRQLARAGSGHTTT